MYAPLLSLSLYLSLSRADTLRIAFMCMYRRMRTHVCVGFLKSTCIHALRGTQWACESVQAITMYSITIHSMAGSKQVVSICRNPTVCLSLDDLPKAVCRGWRRKSKSKLLDVRIHPQENCPSIKPSYPAALTRQLPRAPPGQPASTCPPPRGTPCTCS